jgi:hypothetical protein
VFNGLVMEVMMNFMVDLGDGETKILPLKLLKLHKHFMLTMIKRPSKIGQKQNGKEIKNLKK